MIVHDEHLGRLLFLKWFRGRHHLDSPLLKTQVTTVSPPSAGLIVRLALIKRARCCMIRSRMPLLVEADSLILSPSFWILSSSSLLFPSKVTVTFLARPWVRAFVIVSCWKNRTTTVHKPLLAMLARECSSAWQSLQSEIL